MSTLWWYTNFLSIFNIFDPFWGLLGKKSVIFAHFSHFSPIFVILHFQNYFCHIKTFYLYFSLLFKLVDLVFCQFSCHFRHFSAFLGFFCAPPTTNLAPFWGHFWSYFPKNNYFPDIFHHIWIYIYGIRSESCSSSK